MQAASVRLRALMRRKRLGIELSAPRRGRVRGNPLVKRRDDLILLFEQELVRVSLLGLFARALEPLRTAAVTGPRAYLC